MRRHVAVASPTAGSDRRSASSIACLAFVLAMATAFWAGAVWIAQFLIQVGSLRF